MTDLPERTEGEVASQSIPVTVGGQPVSLPVLRIGRNREWVDAFRSIIDGILGGTDGIESMGDLVSMGSRSLDKMGEAIRAYDESGALGPGYPDNAFPSEVRATFGKVLSAAFPFDDEPVIRLVQLIQARHLAKVATSASTSSSPPTTDGRPRTSKKS